MTFTGSTAEHRSGVSECQALLRLLADVDRGLAKAEEKLHELGETAC